jgi:archaellum biogenesis ATPase FlaH
VIDNSIQATKILSQTNKQCAASIAKAIRSESTYNQLREACYVDQSSLNIHSVGNDVSQSIEVLQLTFSFK